MADQLANGMKFRTLTIVDVFNKEALAMEWVSACEASMWCYIKPVRGRPEFFSVYFVDNGSEFSEQLLDLWASNHWRRTLLTAFA
ncbi:MAG: hypothetical protein NTAFB09_14700 [Nitrosospira sp.]